MTKLTNKNNFIVDRDRHDIDPVRRIKIKESMVIACSRGNGSRLTDSKHPAVNKLSTGFSFPGTYFAHLITLKVRRTPFKKRCDTFFVILRLKAF